MLGRIIGLKAATILCALFVTVGGVVVGARSTDVATPAPVVVSATSGDGGGAAPQATPSLVRRLPPRVPRPNAQETPDAGQALTASGVSTPTPSTPTVAAVATALPAASSTPQQSGGQAAAAAGAASSPLAPGAAVPGLGNDVRRGMHSIRGVVLRVGANQLVLRRPEARGEGRVFVTASTTLRERGRKITLSDIHPGDRVVVIGVPRPDGALEAAAIAVFLPA